MTESEFSNQIRDAERAAWHRYIDFLAPLRPDLYRFCRRRTGDIWDAEVLVQHTICAATLC
jgi:RNA polymerase sigma-70 factor (ECF subfamily)